MEKKPRGRPRKKIENATINNGLNDALFGTSYAINPNGTGAQVSQWDTLYDNLRYYLISNNRQLLSQCYCEIGLIKAIVDIPVEDGLRGGIRIKSKQLSEEQVQELEVAVDRDDDLTTFAQALKWNRLYGGAGIVVIDGNPPEEPLDLELIEQGDNLKFRAVDMWELFWDKQNVEGFTPELQDYEFEYYNYYGRKLHKSRVFRLKGLTAPSFIRPRLRGWGLSEIEVLIRSINQYLKAVDLSFEVLDEFKVDVYRLKDLANTLIQPDGDALVRQRVQTANRQKNYQNAITLDSEDEYQQKQLSFSGLAEAMMGIRLQVASDMRMPLTKLFGESTSGFSSGQDSIENYNANIEGSVRAKIKHHILKMLEIKCKVLFGFVPDDLAIEFNSLRVLSAEQEENIKNSKLTRLISAFDKGILSPLQFKQAINKDNLLGVQLDLDGEVLPTEIVALDDLDKTEKEPGANIPETKNPQLKEKKEISNSIEFDIAEYHADTDNQPQPEYLKRFHVENPGGVDETKWKKAKEVSKSAFGEIRWPFVMWYYKTKLGGELK